MRNIIPGVVALLILASGTAFAADSSPGSMADLPNPPDIRSRHGVLDVTLTAKPGRVTVAGRTFTSNVYNGLYVPPTLRLKPGDTLRLRLVDQTGPANVQIRTPQPTNLHYHGTDVSPMPPADNVLIEIGAGKTFDYVVPFPRNHPEGLHWYHPHAHGFVEGQILSGMSGMLIVDGYIEDHYPELALLRRRVMVLKDIYLPGQDESTPVVKTINGHLDPPIRARPGEYQVWQVGNLGADGYFHLSLDNHVFWTIERDGNVLLKPERQATLFLAPGARATVVVKADDAGHYALRSLAVDTGPQGDPNPEVGVLHGCTRLSQTKSC